MPRPRPLCGLLVPPVRTVYRSAGRPAVIDRAVYGTIVVTSVLVVYDGWAHLKLSDAIAIILGPVVAMVIGHVFAASLAAYPKLGRRPTERELLVIVRHESRFLLVCVPQIVLLVVLMLAGLGLNTSVRVVIWASAASLGFWGGVAARRAGLPGRGIALGVITGWRQAPSSCCCRCFSSRARPSPTAWPRSTSCSGRSVRGHLIKGTPKMRARGMLKAS